MDTDELVLAVEEQLGAVLVLADGAVPGRIVGRLQVHQVADDLLLFVERRRELEEPLLQQVAQRQNALVGLVKHALEHLEHQGSSNPVRKSSSNLDLVIRRGFWTWTSVAPKRALARA